MSYGLAHAITFTFCNFCVTEKKRKSKKKKQKKKKVTDKRKIMIGMQLMCIIKR